MNTEATSICRPRPMLSLVLDQMSHRVISLVYQERQPRDVALSEFQNMVFTFLSLSREGLFVQRC